MKIIYAIGCPFNFPGLGKTAFYEVKAIADVASTIKVFTPCFNNANLSDINNLDITSFPLNPYLGKIHNRITNYYLKDTIFDNWVKNKVKNTDCDIFWGWSSHCFATLNYLKSKNNKVITLLERESVEINFQERILIEEYKSVGINIKFEPKKLVERISKEQLISDYISVPSKLVANSFIEFGINENRIKINPLGVDIDRFTVKENYEVNDFKLIYIGIIAIRKGIHRLINIWKKLNLKNAELLMIGNIYKKEKSYFEGLFKDCPNLLYINGTNNPENYYKKSSVFILPSVEDGFGSVVLEAMACGLPVLVSDRVGAKDCISIGINGFIYTYDNEDELADKILFFYKNRNKIQEFGINARDNVQKYSWGHYIEREKIILKEIIEQSST
jgi:glycosyltransferase involved in cell wall biosynthesis